MTKAFPFPLRQPLPIARSRAARRVALAASIGLTLAGTLASSVPAQSTAPTVHRRSRAKVFGIAGTILGGLAGWGFGQAAKSSPAPLIVSGAVGGGLFGFFIGREFDQSYRTNFRGVPPLRPPNVAAELEGDPVAMAVQDSTIAVAGSVGVQLFTNDSKLSPGILRAAGVRGIITVDLAPRSGWMVLGSPAGLYLYPPGQGPGSLIRDGDVSAAVAGPDRVYFIADHRIEVAPVKADTTRQWPGIDLPSPARALAVDTAHGILWAATDSALFALRPAGDSLVRVGEAPLGLGARRLAVNGPLLAVALGERGVRLYDITVPVAPSVRADWTMARFAYDVSLDASRMFVAAGPEGVYVVDVSGTQPQTIGLARVLGFASALVSYHGDTFVLDRRTNQLRRFASDF